jgi:hypothetical protein
MDFLIRGEPVQEHHLLVTPDQDPKAQMITFALRRYAATTEGFLFFLRGLFEFTIPLAQEQAFAILRGPLTVGFDCCEDQPFSELIAILFHAAFASPR